MWQFVEFPERDARTRRFSATREGAPVTYREVIQAWQSDKEFRTVFNDTLAKAEFSAFRWETPPVTLSTVDRPFEFVLLNEASLQRRVDQASFAEHFESAQFVVGFDNLRGDAHLVVPCPVGPTDAYGHLASFVRSAPEHQRNELWRTVGESMAARLGDQPLWLSTAGMGVSWLHVRFDSRPKYYSYTPYCTHP